MYTRHGPNLNSMTRAERDIALLDISTTTHRRAERQIQRLAPDQRRVSNKAIMGGRRDIIKIRAERAKRNQRTETTARQRLLSGLTACLETDISCYLLNAVPAGGISVTVDVGEPAVRTIIERTFGMRNRSGYRQRQTHYAYAITLGRGRTAALNAAGLNLSADPLSVEGVIDERLILDAGILYQDGRLTVISCATARVHNRYDLRLDEETGRGKIGPKRSFLSVWHARGMSEERWHKSFQGALDSQPPKNIRAAILHADRRLTDEEVSMIAESGLCPLDQ